MILFKIFNDSTYDVNILYRTSASHNSEFRRDILLKSLLVRIIILFLRRFSLLINESTNL